MAGGPVKTVKSLDGIKRSCAPFIAYFAMSGRYGTNMSPCQLPEGLRVQGCERFGFPTRSTENTERMEHPESEAATE